MSNRTQTSGSLGYHRVSLRNVSLSERSAATWGDAVAAWEQYVREKEDQMLVFINRDTGEFSAGMYSHRFRQSYTKMQYAKIQGFCRGALEAYDDPHLAILTLSNSSLKPNGEPKPPIDHLEELLGSWPKVYRELVAVMNGERASDPWGAREWEYLWILEPHTDEGRVPGGYGHVHVGIVADGDLEPERFESVISKHLLECEGARGDAHELESAIDVRPASELNNPGAYLFKYLGESWDVEGMEDYERRFAALLRETGRRRLRASNGAQDWMKREGEASGDYIFAGVGRADAVAKLLEDYEDVEDFRIATGMGVREWLNGRTSRELETGHRWEDTQDVSHEEFEVYGYADGRRSMRVLGSGPDGDRPPP